MGGPPGPSGGPPAGEPDNQGVSNALAHIQWATNIDLSPFKPNEWVIGPKATKDQEKKKRGGAKANKPRIPRKRRKVLLNISRAKEQEDIYSLLHHIDVSNDERRESGRSAKHEELLTLVERTGSSGMHLDDLQCAKIALLQNRSNLIKGGSVNMDELLGI